MWLNIYIRRGVFVARFDVTGKFEDLKAGTGNSEGSTLLVHETSVSACFPIITSGKEPKGQPKVIRIMAKNYCVSYTYNDGGKKGGKMTVTADNESEARVKAGDYFNRMRYKDWAITSIS